jgi:hypothetical protein
MMLALGSFAAFFYTVLIGMVVPPRSDEGVSEYLLGAIARSVLISWTIVFVCHITALPTLFVPSIVVASGVAALTWLRGLPGSLPVGKFNGPALALLAGLAAMLTLNMLLGGTYHAIFDGWDSVLSWNRWARELAQTQYAPQNAAYPILWPGVWSLIYRAQGDSTVWIAAKASMFAVPAIAVLSVGMLVERSKYTAAAVVAIFAFWFFFVDRPNEMLDGMMDAPVAVLVLAAGAAMTVSTRSPGTLLTAAYLVGVAAMTKQAGVILFIPLALVVTSCVMQRRIGWVAAAFVFAVAIAPIAMFLVIYLPIEADVRGNFSHLQDLARGTGSPFETAYTMLRDAWHPVPLLALAALAFLNALRLRTLDGAAGFLFLVLAIVGGFIFADCCSYGARNGWWVISLLVVSAVFTLEPVDRWLAKREPPGLQKGRLIWPLAVLIFSVVLSSAMLLFSDVEVDQAQEKLQWQILWPEVNALIRSNLPIIGEGKIISPYQIIGLLPGLGDQYVLCYSNEDDCARNTLEREQRSFLLVADQQGYPSLYPQLSKGRFLGEINGWYLYGPYGHQGR